MCPHEPSVTWENAELTEYTNTMILLFTIPAFLAFVAYVELTDTRIAFKAMRSHIAKTWGRADWVYPVTRETQTWMRTNTLQSYKP